MDSILIKIFNPYLFYSLWCSQFTKRAYWYVEISLTSQTFYNFCIGSSNNYVILSIDGRVRETPAIKGESPIWSFVNELCDQID